MSFITAGDLRGIGLGIENPAGLIEKVDYYHPIGLRIAYGFTRAANKAPLPDEKPPAGHWYVLGRTPAGAWFYDVQPKKGAAAEEAAASTPSPVSILPTAPAAQAPSIPAPISVATPSALQVVPQQMVVAASPGLSSWVVPAAIGGGFGLLILIVLLRR